MVAGLICGAVLEAEAFVSGFRDVDYVSGLFAEHSGHGMTVEIRLAEPDDVAALFQVRTSVRENHLSREGLAELGITETSVSEMISASPCAWVAVMDDEIVGFSMIDLAAASLFAAFVLPAHEGKGLGTRLVLVAERELFRRHSEIWLETGRDSRAAGFYRHLGWVNEREANGNQIRLTKTRP